MFCMSLFLTGGYYSDYTSYPSLTHKYRLKKVIYKFYNTYLTVKILPVSANNICVWINDKKN